MLESLIARWGYMAVGVGALLEGETVVLAAGAAAHRGLLSFPLVVAIAFAGSVLGDQLWFHVGRRVGPRLLERRPAWSARVAAAERALARFGDAFVLGFRFLYGLRTISPALLGISRYPSARFAVLNAAGAALWAVVVAGAGWMCGAAFHAVAARALRAEELLAAACLIAALAWITRAARRRSRR